MTDFGTAFRSDINPATGGWRDQSETVKRKASALTRTASKWWIGVASNGEAGCRQRWNAKYKALGMQHMAFRAEMERELIDFFSEHVDNAVGGGGGGASDDGGYCVYIAWK